MTISSEIRKAGPFVGNDIASAFPFSFKVFHPSEVLVVKLNVATATESELVLIADYTVSMNTNQNTNPGGTVTLVAGALATGYTLTITSKVQNLQPTDLTNQGGFYPEVITDSLDRATIQIQQLKEQADRSFRLPISSTATPEFPPPEASNLIGWDSIASGLDNIDPSTLATIVAYATAVADIFTGDGSTKDWTLSRDPGTLYGLDVSLDGLTLVPGSEYTLDGTKFSTVTAAPLNKILLVKYKEGLPNTSGDSQDFVYLPPGTGAVVTNVQAKLREFVSVKDFGALGDGITNDSINIQIAIDSGYSLWFPEGTYLCSNLTQTIDSQRFYANGNVNWVKHANGPIFTSSGNSVELNGILARGESATPSFTGDNLVFNGNNPRLINCGSRWAYGRAVKATGGHVQIIGTCDLYQTVDTSGTGYDIEIGVSGTATLYHELTGIYSSQPTGGILLVDTGTHHISGGQFGKLTLQSGTSPAGSNGGITTGARILGNVSVGLSNAMFSANQFGAVTVTFQSGTASCSIDESNIFSSGSVIANNGNTNNYVARNVSPGSVIQTRYGDDTNYRDLTIDPADATQGWQFDGSTVIPSGQAYKVLSNNGTTTYSIGTILGANNNITLGDNTAGFTLVSGGAGGVYLSNAGITIAQAHAVGIRPAVDNAFDLGGSGQRWRTVYATTGTINTSDGRVKCDIQPLTEVEKLVALSIKELIKKFRFRDDVEEDPQGARFHVGVIAQEVMEAFRAESLDPMDYGIVQYDEWQGEEELLDKDGNIMRPRTEPGNRYGIRYDELIIFMASVL